MAHLHHRHAAAAVIRHLVRRLLQQLQRKAEGPAEKLKTLSITVPPRQKNAENTEGLPRRNASAEKRECAYMQIMQFANLPICR